MENIDGEVERVSARAARVPRLSEERDPAALTQFAGGRAPPARPVLARGTGADEQKAEQV
ncbi:hypothetical protein [Streptomyces sp. 142MFCol3.1]|uniref:hypothetical protein n=1 Tax=Streptomyces sp. 142MFCol3.1 TaxID=1172179 RepID=UPI001319C82E|nr:hypothetical protein [Streptomyces sp. 142MFCol3.1]